MSEEASTAGAVGQLIGCTLADYGLDVDALFRDAGLESRSLLVPDTRYPFAPMQAVWRLAAERSGDPCFGLAVAEHMRPQMFHGLGFVWLSSETLLDALRRLVRYQRLISTVVSISLAEDDELIRFMVNSRRDVGPVEPASIDAAIGGFLQMCRLSMCRPFHPVRVSLQRARPSCADRFGNFFRAPVQFSAGQNALYLDPEQLREPLPGADPELLRANDRVVVEHLSRFERETLSLRVRSLLIELLPGGQPTQHDVASSLNLSVRNLQRKLHAEGVSFKQLLDDTRRELATQYICDSRRRIGEITYLLGFSEPSNFTRAFRRWTGLAPNEFRHRREGRTAFRPPPHVQ